MSEHSGKTLSFITRKAPYGQSWARACLDMVLSAAVFDQRINYIFMDDGVYQLLREQDSTAIQARNLSAAFPALPVYGVETIHVDRESLQQRGLDEAALCVDNVVMCSTAEIQTLIRNSDLVFNL